MRVQNFVFVELLNSGLVGCVGFVNSLSVLGSVGHAGSFHLLSSSLLRDSSFADICERVVFRILLQLALVVIHHVLHAGFNGLQLGLASFVVDFD